MSWVILEAFMPMAFHSSMERMQMKWSIFTHSTTLVAVRASS